jgi:hypothetical protein
MSTAIAPYVNASLQERRDYAQTLASAGDLLPKGLWANVKNAETGLMENKPSPGKVMLIVETGLMLGLHPMAALQGIDVIEGNPTLKPSLMSALIRQAGHSLRIEPSGTIAGGDIACTTTIIRSDDPDFPYVYTWTMDDALAAGLIDSYEPNAAGAFVVKARSDKGGIKPWEAYTKRMLRWRSLSDAASAAAEDVLLGMHYTPEELGATVNADGEVVEMTDIPQPKPAEDWTALIAAATTRDDLVAIRDRADAAGEYDGIRMLFLTKIGEISRADTPAAQEENIVDAEVVKEEPAAPEAAVESDEERYERESREEFEAQLAGAKP